MRSLFHINWQRFRLDRKEVMETLLFVLAIWLIGLSVTFPRFGKYVLIGLGILGGAYMVIGYVVFWTYYVRVLRWRSKHESRFSWKGEMPLIITFTVSSWVIALGWPHFVGANWSDYKSRPV
jgi:hypothetical protein